MSLIDRLVVEGNAKTCMRDSDGCTPEYWKQWYLSRTFHEPKIVSHDQRRLRAISRRSAIDFRHGAWLMDAETVAELHIQNASWRYVQLRIS